MTPSLVDAAAQTFSFRSFDPVPDGLARLLHEDGWEISRRLLPVDTGGGVVYSFRREPKADQIALHEVTA